MRIGIMLVAAVCAATVAAGPAQAGTTAVAITDYTFTPTVITVHPGDRVTWTNGDSVPHTAAAIDGTSFDTGAIDPGGSASLVFSKPGDYPYHCAIHPDMRGTVDVK
jgi:plastocyanin